MIMSLLTSLFGIDEPYEHRAHDFGYRVLKVRENSPCFVANVQPYFDFIVAVNDIELNQDPNSLIDALKLYGGSAITLTIYSIKEKTYRSAIVRKVDRTANTWDGAPQKAVCVENIDNITKINEISRNLPISDVSRTLPNFNNYSVINENNRNLPISDVNRTSPNTNLNTNNYNMIIDNTRNLPNYDLTRNNPNVNNNYDRTNENFQSTASYDVYRTSTNENNNYDRLNENNRLSTSYDISRTSPNINNNYNQTTENIRNLPNYDDKRSLPIINNNVFNPISENDRKYSNNSDSRVLPNTLPNINNINYDKGTGTSEKPGSSKETGSSNNINAIKETGSSERTGTSDDNDAVLGVDVYYSNISDAEKYVWHVLEVYYGSPADISGLRPYSDYIIGSDSLFDHESALYELIEENDGHALKLVVYNAETDAFRTVTVVPSRNWKSDAHAAGGDSLLGCGIGFGLLHRIPSAHAQINTPVSLTKLTPTSTDGINPKNLDDVTNITNDINNENKEVTRDDSAQNQNTNQMYYEQMPYNDTAQNPYIDQQYYNPYDYQVIPNPYHYNPYDPNAQEHYYNNDITKP